METNSSTSNTSPAQAPSAQVPPAQTADATAQFEALLQPILQSAYSTAYYLTRSREDAEDLLQESAILAFRAFDGFERDTNFKAWFGRVLHNCFLQRVRTAGRRPQTVSAEDDDQLDALYLFDRTRQAGMHGRGQGDPAGMLLDALDGDQIRDALVALPDEYRVVATLYFVQELTYEQIAQVVECPLNTVRSRLHRSRRLLQRALWELAQERGLVLTDDPASAKRPRNKNSSGLSSLLLILLVPMQACAFSCAGTTSKKRDYKTGGALYSYHVQNQPFRP
jgi:RNA polymerase sigma-70 factor (ECF subfamily)